MGRFLSTQGADDREEIDKIGHDTEFNGIPLFRGRDVEIGPDGTSFGDVEFGQIEIGYADVRLSEGPFQKSDPAYRLKCGVKTSNDTNVSGADWNLIYGSGRTSHCSVQVGIVDSEDNVGNKEKILLDNLKVSNFQQNNAAKTWSRTLSYNRNGIAFEIQQNVKISDKTANEQYYEISYQFKNLSGQKLSVDFMYNCDTAYNNNDHCEGYYIGNTRVNKSMLYTTDDSIKAYGNANIQEDIPDSFSVFNQSSALQFTEKINIDPANKPDVLSLGIWTQVDKWDYYEENKISDSLGKNLVYSSTSGRDLAFSMIWLNREMDAGETQTFGLKQGMAAAQTDSNVNTLPRTMNSERLSRHDAYNSLWIQSGANQGEDMELVFEEMNCELLGLNQSGVHPKSKAIDAIEEVENALLQINGSRSKIGAQQNRLEFTIQHEQNYSENISSAESNIRDTDMAKEMANFSKHGILEQAGQAMLAQANQTNQGVLQLLQG